MLRLAGQIVGIVWSLAHQGVRARDRIVDGSGAAPESWLRGAYAMDSDDAPRARLVPPKGDDPLCHEMSDGVGRAARGRIGWVSCRVEGR